MKKQYTDCKLFIYLSETSILHFFEIVVGFKRRMIAIFKTISFYFFKMSENVPL
jgi:hypothetical protein